ncbi:metal ABC transporter solute-binding protein, Zn/Mn family [Desulforamulus aeronauticus]|uniref:Zinc transport system substrate-binding protein n=1 Tax=Desulforamulus aeronauticus DSM 10349 TaxID=1121421 RepID=A0A1M6WPX5_9FIRM|nr:zinc ABC transporter substrate-binding protein [Desulforamulus aeronauticus]SHK95822.1 zinc transport system substrate-binding protein [Desulforamulus aeronauticus DSM 10349]
MKKSTILLTCLFLLTLLTGGCGTTSSEQSSTPKEQLRVFTGIYPLYDFAKHIGSDKISIKNIIPAGAEPHDWEPSPQDIAEITKADVLILSGSGMEPWADKVLGVIDQNKVTVIYAAQNIKLLDPIPNEQAEHSEQHEDKHSTDTQQTATDQTKEHSHDQDLHPEDSQPKEADTHDHDHAGKDPHIWLDPLNAKTIVDTILAGLIKVDEKNKAVYESNAEAYKKELDQLHEEYQTGLANAKLREFITSHAAFGYLAERYHLIQIPVRGLAAESEPSPADMATIVKLAQEKNIKYIFFETLVSPKVSEAIASELKGQTLVLDPLESLSDQDIAAGKDYLSGMRENLKNLKTALEAP